MLRLTHMMVVFLLALLLPAGCTPPPTVTRTVIPPGPIATDTPLTPVSTEYFFDSINGDDNAIGTSKSTPWKSLAKMNGHEFKPGDIINLRRGSFWTGGLVITRSGTAANPITFRAYGDGENPIFENPGDGVYDTHAVHINGSYITMENILARNSFYSGFYIGQNASHNVIREVEATNTGIGIAVNGANNLITNSYIHDLKMVVNDVGGAGNDYGAVGVEIFNGPNEISYNRLINCRAPSHDFGYDGGALEIYLLYGNADNSSFHHNYAENTNGFIEIHSRDLLYSANNVTIAQNVIVASKNFLDIGLPGYGGGHELKSAQNIRLGQNTYVDAIPLAESDWAGSIFSFHDVTPGADQISIQNNIIYTMNSWWIAKTEVTDGGFTHTNNIYYLNAQRSELGFTLTPTEKRIDPQFVDIKQYNLHLAATSPAIDAGIDLGYVLDFDDHPMPNGTAPDIGAYEY
jgi:hypothetical protein